jgi:tryptophan-rich sensory protein
MLSAWAQIIIFVAAALVANIIIYLFNYYKYNNPYYIKSPLLPPGVIIGIIWLVIFGFFGYAHYLVYKETEKWTVANIAIIVVAVFCLFYLMIVYYRPEYTKFFNCLSLIFAFTLGILVFNESENAFWWIIPFIAWSAYVNLADSLIIHRYESNKKLELCSGEERS